MLLKSWFDEIRSLAMENTVLFVLSYLLLISALDSSFKMLLGTNLNISLPYFYLNVLSFGILYFLLLSILHFFSNTDSINNSVMKLSSIFWILATAAVITCAVGGNISFLNLMNLSSIKELLLFGNKINNGLSVFYLIVLLMSILIIENSKKDKLKSSIFGLFGALSSFISFLVVFSQYNITGISGNDPFSIGYQKHLGTLLLILLTQLFLVAMIFLFIWKRDMLKNYFSNIKGFRSLHFVSMTAVGFIVLSQLNGHIFEFTDPANLTFFVLPPLCMVLTWQFTAMVNDIYDIEIDRVAHPDRPLVTGQISLSTYRNTAIVLAVLSLMISLYLGLLLTLLNLTFITAAIMYSKPPVRLKERVYGYICVGYASVVAFHFGVYSQILWPLSVKQGRWFILEGVPIFRDIFSISLIIFVALSISPYINALSDYEADKKTGVNNIYTIYGRETGKKIVTVLIIFLFLSPLPLFYDLLDLALFLPISLIAAYIYYTHEDHRPIFILYFMIILYSVVRYTGFL